MRRIARYAVKLHNSFTAASLATKWEPIDVADFAEECENQLVALAAEGYRFESVKALCLELRNRLKKAYRLQLRSIPKVERRIIELASEGTTYQQIAEFVDLPASDIAAIVARHKRKRKSLTPDIAVYCPSNMVDEIDELEFIFSKSKRPIARKHGAAIMVDLSWGGYTQREIREKYGVCFDMIAKIIEEAKAFRSSQAA